VAHQARRRSTPNICSVSVGLVADLSPEEAEVLRRSIAMLPPQVPSGLSRERALAILGQLVRALRELRHRANSGRAARV